MSVPLPSGPQASSNNFRCTTGPECLPCPQAPRGAPILLGAVSTRPRFIINVTDSPLTLLGPEEKVCLPKPQALVLMRTCQRVSELFLWGIQQWLRPSAMGGHWSQSCPVAASSQCRAEGAASPRQVQRRQLGGLGAPWLVQGHHGWNPYPCGPSTRVSAASSGRGQTLCRTLVRGQSLS